MQIGYAIFKPFSASQVLDLHFPSFQATRVQFQDQVRSSFAIIANAIIVIFCQFIILI